MLPRRSSLTRPLSLIALLTFCAWMWLSAPKSVTLYDPDFLFQHGVGTIDFTRNNTVKTTSMSPRSARKTNALSTQTNKTSGKNNTLEEMRQNMTLIKVNMSGLGQILKHVNNSNSLGIGDEITNPHPFKFILNTENVCKDKEVFLLIYIHTATSHFKRRTVIRQTWGNPKYYPDTPVKRIFVMGKAADDSAAESEQSLQFESEQYGDIVQEDFLDTYKNLTYKGIAALKWISTHCSHAKFVLKTDDDIFVNMFTLLRHLRSFERVNDHNKSLLMCLVWSRMKVMREGKWAISVDEFKDEYYPTYCSGSAFTMSIDVALSMYSISYRVAFFWVDDFYITGMLALKLGLKHKQFMSTYVLDGRELEAKFTGPQWFTYVFSHVHNLDSIQSVWDTLMKLAKGDIKAEVKYALPGQLPSPKVEIKP